MIRSAPPLVIATAGLALLTGCASGALPGPPTAASILRAAIVEIHASPDCTCCHGWQAYLEDHGAVVEVIATTDMTAFKRDTGVPAATWSCHTALVDGYVVEGHVPIEAIEDLLQDRPGVDGIGLPGMPAGSPGMPGDKEAPFEVLAFTDGSTSPFGSY